MRKMIKNKFNIGSHQHIFFSILIFLNMYPMDVLFDRI